MKKKGKRRKQGAEKLVFQVVDESSRAEDDADERGIERTEPEKAKIVEAQRELDSVGKGIEGRRQIDRMNDEFWKRTAAEDENDELLKTTAREEDLKDMEQGRQRELDRDQNNNNKQEELSEKQKWAVTQVNQIEMMYLERERGGRGKAFLSRWEIEDEDTQETAGDKIMTTPAEKEQKEEEDILLKERKKESTLRSSLFPNVPPFLNFVPANSLPGIKIRSQSEGLKNMGWNMVAPRGKIPASDITQKEGWAIQDCARYNGFNISWITEHPFEENVANGHIWDSCAKLDFCKLQEEVKTNFFPGVQQLGNKSNLYRNYLRLREKHGKKMWDFMPQMFVLPEQNELLKAQMEKGSFWIIKPPNLARGKGISVVDQFEKVPKTTQPICVQRYLMHPFLIDGRKFDLRVYVLVTSIDPLRIYVYEEGLARFATELFTTDPDHIGNNFIHLTNYSINRDSENFEQNTDPHLARGSKWTLSSLWKYLLENFGIQKTPIWDEVKDIVIKSILSAKTTLQKEYKQVKSHYNCYMLLGFDILIDSSLKAHLIEINRSPSMNAKPFSIESHVKQPLVSETFNIVGLHPPHGLVSKDQADIMNLLGIESVDHLPSNLTHDPRVYSRRLTEEDLRKEREHNMERENKDDKKMEYHNEHKQEREHKDHKESGHHKEPEERERHSPNRSKPDPQLLLQALTPRDVRILVQAEEELSQTKMFQRIWPTNSTHHYFKYFESLPYSEKLMDSYENLYGNNRRMGQALLSDCCQRNLHLK